MCHWEKKQWRKKWGVGKNRQKGCEFNENYTRKRKRWAWSSLRGDHGKSQFSKEGVTATSQEHIETEVRIMLMLNMVLQRARCRNRGGWWKKSWDTLHSGKEANENKEANERSNQEKKSRGYTDWDGQWIRNNDTKADSNECSDVSLFCVCKQPHPQRSLCRNWFKPVHTYSMLNKVCKTLSSPHGRVPTDTWLMDFSQPHFTW